MQMLCAPCPHMTKSNISLLLSTCFSSRWDTNTRTLPYSQMKYFHYLLLIIQFSNVWLGALWNGNLSKEEPNVTKAPVECEQKSWVCPPRARRTAWSGPCYLWQLLLQQVYTILSSQDQSITGTSGLVQICSQAAMLWNYCSSKCFHSGVHGSQSMKTANRLYPVCNKQLNKKVTAK